MVSPDGSGTFQLAPADAAGMTSAFQTINQHKANAGELAAQIYALRLQQDGELAAAATTLKGVQARLAEIVKVHSGLEPEKLRTNFDLATMIVTYAPAS